MVRQHSQRELATILLRNSHAFGQQAGDRVIEPHQTLACHVGQGEAREDLGDRTDLEDRAAIGVLVVFERRSTETEGFRAVITQDTDHNPDGVTAFDSRQNQHCNLGLESILTPRRCRNDPEQKESDGTADNHRGSSLELVEAEAIALIDNVFSRCGRPRVNEGEIGDESRRWVALGLGCA
jgi:hypothetical protein